jgi:hypothetical protein
MASIFTLNTVLFVGVSLNDPELMVMLDYLANTFEPGSRPIHCALIAEGEINPIEEKCWLKDYLIQIVPISSTNNYANVPGAIQALVESVTES